MFYRWSIIANTLSCAVYNDNDGDERSAFNVHIILRLPGHVTAKEELHCSQCRVYLKSCCVKLCKRLHLVNYDITISPLAIRNTGYAEVPL